MTESSDQAFWRSCHFVFCFLVVFSHVDSFMLLNVHGGGMTYQERGQSGKGTG